MFLYEHPQSALCQHAPNLPDYTAYGVLSPFEPVPRCSSPGAATPTSRASSLSPPSPLRWTATSSATAYSTLPTSGFGDNNTLLCEDCGQNFTGKHRQGNLRRHIRLKHGEARRGSYMCLAEGCFDVFQRSDARLKHARSKHPELNLPPSQRRHGTEHDATNLCGQEDVHVAQDLNYNVGQWLQAEQGIIGNHTSTMQHEVDAPAGVEQLLLAAKCVFSTLHTNSRPEDYFSTLHTNLRPKDYSRICDSFFERWASIVQQLKDDQYVSLEQHSS
jgi:hypothetical protein